MVKYKINYNTAYYAWPKGKAFYRIRTWIARNGSYHLWQQVWQTGDTKWRHVNKSIRSDGGEFADLLANLIKTLGRIGYVPIRPSEAPTTQTKS